jgi:hypothetical protein
MDDKIVDLEAQVADLGATDVTGLRQEVETIESEKDALQSSVANRFYAGLVAGAIVALAVGFGAGQFWRRWQHGEPI